MSSPFDTPPKKYKVIWALGDYYPDPKAEFDQFEEARTPEEVGAILRDLTWNHPYVREVRILIQRPVRLDGHHLELPGEPPDILERS